MENIEPDFVVDITGFTDKKIEVYFGLQSAQRMMRLQGTRVVPISSKILKVLLPFMDRKACR
jgi:hypothetical protein